MRLSLTISMVAAVIALSSIPAAAGTTTFADPVGDGYGYDIRRVVIRNDVDVVSMRAKVRDLRNRRIPQIIGMGITHPRRPEFYSLTTVRWPNGYVRSRLTLYDGSNEPVVPNCNVRARWLLARDVIQIRFGQRCLEVHRGFRASVYMGAGDGTTGDPHDFTRSVWVSYN